MPATMYLHFSDEGYRNLLEVAMQLNLTINELIQKAIQLMTIAVRVEKNNGYIAIREADGRIIRLIINEKRIARIIRRARVRIAKFQAIATKVWHASKMQLYKIRAICQKRRRVPILIQLKGDTELWLAALREIDGCLISHSLEMQKKRKDA